jgi:hypothetical protein
MVGSYAELLQYQYGDWSDGRCVGVYGKRKCQHEHGEANTATE